MPPTSPAADLSQQFQQAADRISNLPPEQAGPEMHTLYGLYKQATDGDHDTFRGEVGREDHDNPDGPAGLSQAQWDSWSQFKGVPQAEAMRRYVAEAAKLTGSSASTGSGKRDGQQTLTVADEPNQSAAEAFDYQTNAPLTGTEAAAANIGLRGDLRAGAPYGSEEERKDDDDAQRGSAATR